jgi:hypothetical protein
VFTFLRLANASLVKSKYSSALNTTSPMFLAAASYSMSLSYFEAIQIKVNTAGYYDLRSISKMDTYGYLYRDTFDPIYPELSLLGSSDEEGGDSQFLFSIRLETSADYILVATTFEPYVTGTFSILATGPDSVWFSLIDTKGSEEYLANNLRFESLQSCHQLRRLTLIEKKEGV